ncbi:MAG: hypothetical protein AABY86_04965, partial [Bdellovibrionota bacterium]
CNRSTQYKSILVATMTNYQDDNIRKWYEIPKDSCQKFSFSPSATVFHYGTLVENTNHQWSATERDGFPMCIQGDNYFHNPDNCSFGFHRYYFRTVVFPKHQTQYILNLND